MTNTEKLKEIIDNSGYKFEYVAGYIGMTRCGLYKKLQDGSEFKPSQILKLCELLRIEEAQRAEIFLI